MKPARAPVATERPLMQIAVNVRVTDSPDKLVKLPAQDYAVAMGMHDELADFYGAAPGSFSPHASTLDYVVGARGACLASTFKRSLAARGIRPKPAEFGVEAIGEVVVDGDVPVIRRVDVR
jgi:hypothetical protein